MPAPPDDRHTVLDALRAAAPCYRDEGTKTFVLTRMSEVRALLTTGYAAPLPSAKRVTPD